MSSKSSSNPIEPRRSRSRSRRLEARKDQEEEEAKGLIECGECWPRKTDEDSESKSADQHSELRDSSKADQVREDGSEWLLSLELARDSSCLRGSNVAPESDRREFRWVSYELIGDGSLHEKWTHLRIDLECSGGERLKFEVKCKYEPKSDKYFAQVPSKESASDSYDEISVKLLSRSRRTNGAARRLHLVARVELGRLMSRLIRLKFLRLGSAVGNSARVTLRTRSKRIGGSPMSAAQLAAAASLAHLATTCKARMCHCSSGSSSSSSSSSADWTSESDSSRASSSASSSCSSSCQLSQSDWCCSELQSCWSSASSSCQEDPASCCRPQVSCPGRCKQAAKAARLRRRRRRQSRRHRQSRSRWRSQICIGSRTRRDEARLNELELMGSYRASSERAQKQQCFPDKGPLLTFKCPNCRMKFCSAQVNTLNGELDEMRDAKALHNQAARILNAARLDSDSNSDSDLGSCGARQTTAELADERNQGRHSPGALLRGGDALSLINNAHSSRQQPPVTVSKASDSSSADRLAPKMKWGQMSGEQRRKATCNLLSPMDFVWRASEARALSCTESSLSNALVAQLAVPARSKSLCVGSISAAPNRQSLVVSARRLGEGLGRKVGKLTRKAMDRMRLVSASNPNMEEDDSDANEAANCDRRPRANSQRGLHTNESVERNNGRMAPQLNRFISKSSALLGERLGKADGAISGGLRANERLMSANSAGKVSESAEEQLWYSPGGVYIGPGGVCSWRDVCAEPGRARLGSGSAGAAWWRPLRTARAQPPSSKIRSEKRQASVQSPVLIRVAKQSDETSLSGSERCEAQKGACEPIREADRFGKQVKAADSEQVDCWRTVAIGEECGARAALLLASPKSDRSGSRLSLEEKFESHKLKPSQDPSASNPNLDERAKMADANAISKQQIAQPRTKWILNLTQRMSYQTSGQSKAVPSNASKILISEKKRPDERLLVACESAKLATGKQTQAAHLAKENRSNSLSGIYSREKRALELSKSTMDLNCVQIAEQTNLYLAELNLRYSISTHELAFGAQSKGLDNNWFKRSYKYPASNQWLQDDDQVLFANTGSLESSKREEARVLYGANQQTICVHCQLIAELASHPASSYLAQLLSPASAAERPQSLQLEALPARPSVVLTVCANQPNLEEPEDRAPASPAEQREGRGSKQSLRSEGRGQRPRRRRARRQPERPAGRHRCRSSSSASLISRSSGDADDFYDELEPQATTDNTQTSLSAQDATCSLNNCNLDIEQDTLSVTSADSQDDSSSSASSSLTDQEVDEDEDEEELANEDEEELSSSIDDNSDHHHHDANLASDHQERQLVHLLELVEADGEQSKSRSSVSLELVVAVEYNALSEPSRGSAFESYDKIERCELDTRMSAERGSNSKSNVKKPKRAGKKKSSKRAVCNGLASSPSKSCLKNHHQQLKQTNTNSSMGAVLEVPSNSKARSASLDAPYLLKVPTNQDLAYLYNESYPSKANRSRSVDISLPTRPGDLYRVRQMASQSNVLLDSCEQSKFVGCESSELISSPGAQHQQKKFIQGEIKVACANGETRALKLFVDWRENCVNGEHLWIYVGSSSEACYVGENECLKHGPRLCCSSCKITAHTSCISILIDKIKFICKHTFKDLTVNNPRHLKELQQQNVIYHHWVHKRTHCGRCKQCTKTFGNTKLPFSSKEIQAITCSWCKVSYHNKENCYTLSALTEPCTLGAHRESIIPPPWILKLPINNSQRQQTVVDSESQTKDMSDLVQSDNLIDLSLTSTIKPSSESIIDDSENLIQMQYQQHHSNSTPRTINNLQSQTFGSNITLMTDTSGYMSADISNAQTIMNTNNSHLNKVICINQEKANLVTDCTQNLGLTDCTDEIIVDPTALQASDLSSINSQRRPLSQERLQHPQENMSQFQKHQLRQYYRQIDSNQNSSQTRFGDQKNDDGSMTMDVQLIKQQNSTRQSVNGLYRHFKIVPQPIQGVPNAGSKPVLVFVNPRSGGNQGAKMMQKFNWLLNPRQVFDLIQSGGPRAALELYQDVPNLRILTIGGDGTASWILSYLDELGISNKIPVAVLPLGTGNDLARALAWGGGYTDEPIAKILTQVRDGEIVQLDRWNLQVERNFEAAPSSPNEFSSNSTLGPTTGNTSMEVNSPYVASSPSYFGSLSQCNTNTASAVSIVDQTNCDTNMIQVPSNPIPGFNVPMDESGSDRLPMDVINNYFSFGVDAHIALEFHTAREAHPERFNSRLRNKMFYGQAGGKDLLKRKWKDLSNFVTLYCDGQDMTNRLKELKVHSVLFLNIASYGGGTRPWPTTATSFAKPRTDDGLIEVIGLTTYQLPLLQAGGHGSCIAQCRSARIITSRIIPMQVDGEPCKLLPSIININFRNRVCMLAKSKSSNKNTNMTVSNNHKFN